MDGRRGKPARGHAVEIGVRGHEASPCPAKRVGRTDDERKTGCRGEVLDRLHRLAHARDGNRLADLLQHLFEGLPVLGFANRLDRGAEHAHPVAIEHARVRKVGREIEPGLATQRGQHGVGFLARDDPLHGFDGERLEVDAVGHLLVGHDRRRVGVDKHRLDALFAQRLAGLSPRVIELGRLTDDDRAGTQDQDLARPPLFRTSPGHGPRHRRPAAHHIDEPVVQVLVVLRPRAAFGVVLDAEHRQRAVTEAFDRSIVQVALRDVEVAGGDRGRIDLELVVLAGDVHTAGVEVLDRMVGAVVAVR